MTETFIAADEIAYAANSIVSKTIIKKAAGNISLFAFDKGEELSEHSSPHEAFVQVLDGSAEIKISGKAYTVAAGMSILLPADVPHAVKAVEKFKMLLTMIKN